MSVAEKKSFWERAQALDRRVLYTVLIVLTASSLFIKAEIPVNPDNSSKDFYIALMQAPADKTMLVESDWTNSTRAENAGQYEALLRLMMDRNIKFVVYSLADPQAPQVARDTMMRINEERKKQGLREYNLWSDYLDLGYFPNAEGHMQALSNDIRTAWGGRKERNEQGVDTDIFQSPVLKNIHRLGDASLLVVVSASNTVDLAIERMYGRVTLAYMVTGVMGPNCLPYYQAGQIAGITIGLKGVYDVEYMMKYGLNYPKGVEKPKVSYKEKGDITIEPVTIGTRFGRGAQYFLPLHVALGLMILAIVFGNIAMVASRGRAKK